MAGPATGPLAGYQDAASVAARGATVAASGLFCHATIAEQQQQLGAPDTPRYTTLQQQHQQAQAAPSSASSSKKEDTPHISLGQPLISQLT